MSDAPESNDPLEMLAQQLVNEAFAGLLEELSPEEIAEARSQLLCDLLADPDGRLLLRRCLEDPAVDSSDEYRSPGSADIEPDAADDAAAADKSGRSAS